MVKYPWYEVIENDNQLHQGDIIHACPVIIPKNSLIAGQTVEADVYEYDVIVMNQTCDLTNNKIELVAVCVLWSLEELGSIQRASFSSICSLFHEGRIAC